MKTLNFLLYILLICFNVANSQEDVRSPFVLHSLKITQIQSEENQAQISLLSEFLGTGKIAIKLDITEEMKHLGANYTTSFEDMDKNNFISKNWYVNLPEDGYYFIMLQLAFIPNESDQENDHFIKYVVFPFHFEVRKGKVVDYSTSPSSVFDHPPEQIKKESNELKPYAIPGPPQAEILIESKPSNRETDSYTISVYIYGKVFYEQQADFGSGFSPVNKGYPGIRVRLDWDYDNNPATAYTPYSSSARHIEYDDVDMNGNYYFNFSFTSAIPAYQIAPYIRIYGNANPDGVLDGDRGSGAQFVPFTNTEKIFLSGLTTTIYSQVNPRCDPYTGGATRHIYRGRLFCTNNLGFNPNTIRYYIRQSASNSFFCQNSNGNACSVSSISTSLPFILFNRIPESNLGYHEYGHWIEYNKTGYQHTDAGSHYFELETTQNIAWTEGFAEFYNAATHAYWYSYELPPRLEHLTRSISDGRYELLDATQSNVI